MQPNVQSTQGNADASVERRAMMVVADHATGSLPESRLRRVSQYVQDNLHRELRLAELSGLVHMSPYHFARLFKRSTGVSPHRFLVQRRIEQARALLAAEPLSIAEIARSVGFRTPSHFTTTFRRVTGITPSAYRSGGEAEATKAIRVRRGTAGER
jgi:AraC-like DNA-binding protein